MAVAKKSAAIVSVLVLAVLCICCTFPGSASYAEEAEMPIGFAFEPNGDGTIKITGICVRMDSTVNTGSIPNLVVPEKIAFPAEIDGFTVTELSLYPESYSGPFMRTDLEDVKEIILPDTLVRIDNCCFANSESLKSIVIPEGVEEIPEYAFYRCKNLESVSLPSTLRRIGKNAFGHCENLTSVEFPEALEEIGDEAFNGCESLEKADGLTDHVRIGQLAFLGTPVRKQIGAEKEAPYTENTPDDSDQMIRIQAGNNWFRIPANLTENPKDQYDVAETKDGAYQYILFSDDSCAIVGMKLEEKAKGRLKIPSAIDGHPVIAVLDTVSYDYQHDALEIPEGVRYIGKYAFSNYTVLKVKLPVSLEQIDPDAFYQSYQLIFTREQKERFPEADPLGIPCLYRIMEDGTARVTKWKNHRAKAAEVPGSIDGHTVASIAPNAFANCDVETIVLPERLRTIGFRAFYPCRNLKSVSFPDGLEFIGREAFLYCSKLEKVSFPSKLTFLGENAFRGVPLKEVILPEGLVYLGDYAFWNGGNCRKVVLPGSIAHFGAYVFQGQLKLKDVTVSEGLQTIGEAAFASSGVKSIKLPESMKTIEGGAFAYCESLQTVETGGCETIGEQAFAFCPKLKSVTFGDNLQMIGSAAFLDHGMKEIRLPASLKGIGNSALYPMKPKSPLTITVSGDVTENFHYTLFATAAGKIIWPQKLTIKLSPGASAGAEKIRSYMAEYGISEKEWKLVNEK